MRNIRQLLTDTRKWRNITGTDLEKNSKQVMLWDWKVVEAMDVDGDVFRDVLVKARSKRETGKNQYGPVRKVEFRFYGTDPYQTNAWASCSCEYFKYTAEVALYNNDSSDIKYSNGADPNVRNPSQIPIVCKHIFAALRAGAVAKPINKSLIKEQKAYEKEQEKKKKQKEAEKKRQDARKKEAEKKKLEEQKRKDRQKEIEKKRKK